MIFSHRVALNGVQLDSLDNRILVQGVEEAAGKENISAVSLFGGVGQRITNRHRDYLDVTVRFSLRIRKDGLAARETLMEAIVAWATAGGWLTINYKADRRLRVVCQQLPTPGDPWNWTSTYSIVFRAYAVPYWQQVTPVTASGSGTTVTKSVTVAGSEKTVVDVTYKNNASSSCATFKVTAGGSVIELSSLGLAAGETLSIDHDDDGRLRIRIKNSSDEWRSALDKRTAASSDDLWVNPGTVQVKTVAQRTGAVTVSCAGRYA